MLPRSGLVQLVYIRVFCSLYSLIRPIVRYFVAVYLNLVVVFIYG